MTIVAYKLMLTELEAQLLDGLIRFNVTGSARSHAANLQEIARKLEAGGVRGWEEAEGRVFYADPDKLPGLETPEVSNGAVSGTTEEHPGQ